MKKDAKTEIISCRVPVAKKAELEKEARGKRISLPQLLDQITDEWLARRPRVYTAAEEAEVRKRAMAAIGAVRSGDPTGSSNVSEKVREIIWRKHQKESRAALRRLRPKKG